MAKKKKYYAVLSGNKPGIYGTWSGPNGAESQIRGFSGAKFKSFATRQEAKNWMDHPEELTKKNKTVYNPRESLEITDIKKSDRDSGKVLLFTDGSSLNNPGNGGYGAVLIYKQNVKEISEGYRLTTNNRMELLAVIKGLSLLKYRCSVVVYSDSQYVTRSIQEGWAYNWKKNGWLKKDKTEAVNSDLWKEMLDLLKEQDVEFRWVKGHAGNPGNERCDFLAVQSAKGEHLKTDTFYEDVNK